MKFVDLENLKVGKNYGYDTIEVTIPVEINGPMKNTLEAAKKAFEECDKPLHEVAFYNVGIDLIDSNPAALDDADFLSIVNVISSAFVDYLIIPNKGRKREHRLDVPEKLKRDLRMSLSLIKKLVNTDTFLDVVNLHINCGEWNYDLIEQDPNVDSPSNIIKKDFIHSKDELTSETADKAEEDK